MIDNEDYFPITYSINGSVDCDDNLFDKICEEAADRFPDQLDEESPYWEFSFALENDSVYSAGYGKIM